MNRLKAIFLAALLPALSGACVLLPPRAAAPRRPAAQLSPEAAKTAERLYYKAVGAYSNNDMAAALKYLDQISAIAPAYPPAAELREKIRRISGGR